MMQSRNVAVELHRRTTVRGELRLFPVSRHLKVLYDAGLLTRDRRGTWLYYRISLPRCARR
jgi:hypothetical protein